MRNQRLASELEDVRLRSREREVTRTDDDSDTTTRDEAGARAGGKPSGGPRVITAGARRLAVDH